MKKTIYVTIIALYVIANAGCKKFVDIDAPTTKLITSTVFESDGTATAAVISIYVSTINQNTNPYTLTSYAGMYADELKSYSNIQGLRQIYTNNLNPRDGQTMEIWNWAYNCIYQANSVIEGCNGSTGLSDKVKGQLLGEALFFRAFWHFYLVNSFGPIPLVTSTDYNRNAHLFRSSKDDVYKQIISDLQASISGLNDNYVDASSTNSTEERVRINKSAAYAMLSRVYLFTGNYSEAEATATKVIDNHALYDLTGLDEVFLKNSREAIWQLMKPLPTTQNTPEGSNFILTGKPLTGIGKSNTLSASLLNSFEPNDLRKEKWVGKYSDISVNPSIDYYYPFKYKVASGSEISEYSMVLRLAEQYLIRAEARTQTGNLTGAISDIDIIRQRAGLPLIKDTQPGITKEGLLTAILKERRVELFTEWGHRFLDLKRTGKIDAVLSIEAVSKESSWDSHSQWFPIPQVEINNNPNITQNQGYN